MHVRAAVLCACSLPHLSHQLLQPLPSLTNLQRLALGDSLTVNPQPLSALGALTHLTTLQLKGVAFAVAASTLPGLLCLTALQQFELQGELVHEYERACMQLGVLRNSTALQHLRLEGVSLVPSRWNVGGEGAQSASQGQALQTSSATAGLGGGRMGRNGGASCSSEPCLVPQLQQLTFLELRAVGDNSGVSYHSDQQQHQEQQLSEAERLVVSSRSVLQSLFIVYTGLPGRSTWEDVFLEDAVMPHLTALNLRQTRGGLRQPQLTR
jgi:hypothetical protein